MASTAEAAPASSRSDAGKVGGDAGAQSANWPAVDRRTCPRGNKDAPLDLDEAAKFIAWVEVTDIAADHTAKMRTLKAFKGEPPKAFAARSYDDSSANCFQTFHPTSRHVLIWAERLDEKTWRYERNYGNRVYRWEPVTPRVAHLGEGAKDKLTRADALAFDRARAAVLAKLKPTMENAVAACAELQPKTGDVKVGVVLHPAGRVVGAGSVIDGADEWSQCLEEEAAKVRIEPFPGFPLTAEFAFAFGKEKPATVPTLTRCHAVQKNNGEQVECPSFEEASAHATNYGSED